MVGKFIEALIARTRNRPLDEISLHEARRLGLMEVAVNRLDGDPSYHYERIIEDGNRVDIYLRSRYNPGVLNFVQSFHHNGNHKMNGNGGYRK